MHSWTVTSNGRFGKHPRALTIARERENVMGMRPKKVFWSVRSQGVPPQLMNWLYKRGCQCDFAMSCQEACSLISHTQFDWVLSQYQLPDRNGFSNVGLVGRLACDSFLIDTRGERCLWLPMLRTRREMRGRIAAKVE